MEMDFFINSFVRLCFLDCEFKFVDVVSDKNRFEKVRFVFVFESFICRCLVCDWKLFWVSLVVFFGGFYRYFLI